MENKQIIEVEYNKEMIDLDKKATLENDISLLEQDTFNTDDINNLVSEGGIIDEFTKI